MAQLKIPHPAKNMWAVLIR